MAENTYRYLKPVEIIEYLCQGAANGFQESALEAAEQKLGLQLPAVLRDFLLCAGRERVCAGEPEIVLPDFFQVCEGYLVIGKDDRRPKGILLEDMAKENPPVYVQEAQGKWVLFAESLQDALLLELDRRIRKSKQAEWMAEEGAGHLGRYFYCEYLLCKEWTPFMDSSEVFVPEERWDHIFPEKQEAEQDDEDSWEDDEDWDDEEDDWEDDESDWEDEEEQDSDGECWDCPQGLKEMLLEKSVSLPGLPYSVAICLEVETGILYSACFLRGDQRFVSLIQINEPRAVCLESSFFPPEQYCVEKLLDRLADEVYAPVMAHCLAIEPALPEAVRELADEELHVWIANTVGDFLKLFESNRSWKLGVCVSNQFIACSGIKKSTESESLQDLWYGHHLKADPSPWTPSFVRETKEKETAPEELEPFLKELIYRVHDYNVLNRYAFLARKIVTKDGYSVRTKDFTEPERFALLSFYREMADGIMERIFDCLERKVFTIRIKGKDLISLCGNPTAHLEGWIYQYEKETLYFLDQGCWKG